MNILGFQKTTLLDYPHKIASTIFLGGCNFRCPYCHNKDLVLGNENNEAFSKDEILLHLNKRKNTLDGICITGGEATLARDLYDFISQIKDLGLLVKLDTNGTNSSLLTKLISDGLIDYVAMDIKQCKEKYLSTVWPDELVENKPSDEYKKSCILNITDSVNILKNSDIDYEFRTTICKELFCREDIISIGTWIRDCKAYYLQPYRDNDNVIHPVFSTPEEKTLIEYVEILKDYNIRAEIRGEAL